MGNLVVSLKAVCVPTSCSGQHLLHFLSAVTFFLPLTLLYSSVVVCAVAQASLVSFAVVVGVASSIRVFTQVPFTLIQEAVVTSVHCLKVSFFF